MEVVVVVVVVVVGFSVVVVVVDVVIVVVGLIVVVSVVVVVVDGVITPICLRIAPTETKQSATHKTTANMIATSLNFFMINCPPNSFKHNKIKLITFINNNFITINLKNQEIRIFF